MGLSMNAEVQEFCKQLKAEFSDDYTIQANESMEYPQCIEVQLRNSDRITNTLFVAMASIQLMNTPSFRQNAARKLREMLPTAKRLI